MSQQDTGLYKSFALVLGALVLFTLFILVVANMASPPSDRNKDPLVANNIKRAIEPIGRSNVRAVEEVTEEAEAETAEAESAADAAAEETPDGEAQTEETDATDDAGSAQPADTDAAEAETTDTTEASTPTGVVEDSASDSQATDTANADVEPARVDTSVDIPVKVRAVVATNCAGCHQNGVQGAQRNDDTEAWQGLAGKGIDALTASVINGLGAMPARAESPLDDAELQLAVQHMINQNLAGAAPQASDSDAAGTDATAGSDASTETAATDSEASDSSAATAQASDTESAAATEETTAEAESAAVVIPDNVKVAVDTLCAACHISGVGNAPKYGDKAAWDARMANGLDAVTASAIAGKGAMPARGGSQLTDEEIRLAVQYMLTK